ncbi:Auxin-responsive protein SAUR32 [Glycine soja]
MVTEWDGTVPCLPHYFDSESRTQHTQQQARKKMKVKKGWLAVQVEEETEEAGGVGSQRFVIPISYLCHPLFKHLLDKAYEVYGYHTEGPLKLPCSVDDFLHLRWRIQKESSTHHHHNHNHNHHHHRQLPHALLEEGVPHHPMNVTPNFVEVLLRLNHPPRFPSIVTFFRVPLSFAPHHFRRCVSCSINA